MINKEKILKIFTNALKSGNTPEKLTQSFCIGLFIAFSPFPGVHSVMMLFAKWWFGLNLPILFFATSINNPWTIVPFYSFDYFFGLWFVHNLLGWNPTWIISLPKILGLGKVCLWSFLIGGNLLGLFFAVSCYPIMRFIFNKLANKNRDNYEDCRNE
ncbi:MAG: DUF2062 domain-containing protein [bacterium]